MSKAISLVPSQTWDHSDTEAWAESGAGSPSSYRTLEFPVQVLPPSHPLSGTHFNTGGSCAGCLHSCMLGGSHCCSGSPNLLFHRVMRSRHFWGPWTETCPRKRLPGSPGADACHGLWFPGLAGNLSPQIPKTSFNVRGGKGHSFMDNHHFKYKFFDHRVGAIRQCYAVSVISCCLSS